ncbi:glycerophosphodiester phosphodiesterase [Anaerobaca lacustris]|uniref:Glycerophosphodiester phosphodiesterase n=1 Tax=Anaerobaca lacustris TaxID=3044600 RepID=A0AAW6TZG7_9BACT|nr:glycerophosphodiester phosphodiesterase [Sedimentisphaerales bacterium M17dextr]
MKTLQRIGLLLAALLLSAGCTSKMEIIAHRGASYLAPENTVASAKLAWEKNADAVEVDVYLSADEQVVVIHDRTTKRTAGEELDVAASTTELLRRLDVGSFKDTAYTGERIPVLEEIIETLPVGKRLFVEIKCGPEILPALERIVAESGRRSQIVIIGFSLETVTASKQLMPDLPTYWLVGTKKDEQTEQWIPHDKGLADQAAAAGLDGLNVHWAGVTREFARSVRKAGMGLYVWTVNDSAEAARLAKLGIDGLTTDRPGWLRDELAGAKRLF